MTTSPENEKSLRWDAAEHLTTETDMAAYLEAALEDRDPALIAAALSHIARAKQSLANPISH